MSKAVVWPIAYAVAAALVAGGPGWRCCSAASRRRGAAPGAASDKSDALARVLRTARDAFADFLSRDAALAVLVFVILYKLCDALAGAMTAPFVLSLGYDKGTYAAIVKGVGLAALLIGGFAGGAVATALPLATRAVARRHPADDLQPGLRVALAASRRARWALTVAIVFENFTGAIGTVIFVAYLSALCRNPLHTATQYALLTALASTGRTLLSSGTGFVAQCIGWPAVLRRDRAGRTARAGPDGWLQRRGHFAAARRGAGPRRAIRLRPMRRRPRAQLLILT